MAIDSNQTTQAPAVAPAAPTAANKSEWSLFGKRIGKQEGLVYLFQITVLFIVIVGSIVNLSLRTEGKELWISLLSSSIGILVPQPSIKITLPKETTAQKI